ncbi:acyltransferase family protein, partial [Vibrio campbellii]|uniref:acyltransferase family protein n=1 Tax=Vibrio campbellii TaxID=680 RepID=UPI0005EEB99D
MRKIRFETLDSFRGLCAIFVLVSHLRIESTISDFSFFMGSGRFVEFFFVLSGFVVTHSLTYKKNIEFKSFFLSRVYRLYPLHLFMLLVMLIIETLKLIVFHKLNIVFSETPFTGNYDLKELIPNILLVQAWLPNFHKLSFNGVSWSISIEFYMYIFLFVIFSLFEAKKNIVFFLISSSAFIMIFNESAILTDSAQRGISCFFGGSLLYGVYTKLRNKYKFKSSNLWTIVEVVSLTLIYIVITNEIRHKNIILSIIFLVTVLIFSFELGGVSNTLKHRYFKFLGMLSYSIYMTQTFIISILISL